MGNCLLQNRVIDIGVDSVIDADVGKDADIDRDVLMFIFVFVNDFVAEEEKLRLQLARSLVPGFHEINENGVIL